ncbi:hypothetical protein D9M72_302940 [compost metagenome]
MGRARQHGLRLQFHGGISREGKFDGGFGFGVERHQIGVHIDGAADVVGENVMQGVVECFFDLGLQYFAGELIGHCHQEG